MGIKDRGLKKFRMVAMQPGLFSGIKMLQEEQKYVSMPTLDEQQLEHLDQTICDAMEFNNEVSITYYKNHRYELIVGHIHYFDSVKNCIRVVDKFQEWSEIKIPFIIDIQ